MRINYKNYLFLGLIITITIACKGNMSERTMPDIGIPSTEFNTKMQVSAPDGINTFKIGDSISLAIKIISSEQIWFESNYGARLFIAEGDKWEEIRNGENYPEGSFILAPTGNDYFKVGATAIWPQLPDTTKPVTLRVILVGNVYRNGQMTDEVTAGYVDVNLKP